MKRSPGKFEDCGDQRLGERLYECTLNGWCDEEFGEVAWSGWHGFIYRPKRKRSYVVHEDSQGFFDYEELDSKTAQEQWNEFRARVESGDDDSGS